MTSSQIFLCLCLAFVLGVGIASFFNTSALFSINPGLAERVNFSQLPLLIFLFFSIFLVFGFHKFKSKIVFGICILFLVFGIWRYQLIYFQFNSPQFKKLEAQKVSFVGKVAEEPESKENKVSLKLELKNSKFKILVTTRAYPKINYGDILEVEGTLKPPPEFEGFNYRDYLKKEGIYFIMDYPKLKILKRNQGNLIKTIAIFLKGKLKESLEKLIPLPQVGFFEALIFGDENNIPQFWKERLNLTGTRHLAAVSGMNITIISSLLLNFLLALGFWRKHSIRLSAILISFYILMIGAPASAVRAGIMGISFLISQNFGRLVIPERLLVFALTFMLLFNPLLLKFDVGFQLSFLAMTGLIYLQQIFSKKLSKIPEFFGIRTNLASTLAAQIFTLPILLYNFGQFSLISPITNILILPAIPLLTTFGFLVSILGIFWQGLAQILALFAQLPMLFIMKIIEISSSLPFVTQEIKISSGIVFFCYLLLAILIFRLRSRQKSPLLSY